MTSDHSPVFATFKIAVANQYVSDSLRLDSKHNCRIVFASATAKINTSSKTNFYVDFYGTFLDGTPLHTYPSSNVAHVI